MLVASTRVIIEEAFVSSAGSSYEGRQRDCM